MAKEVQSIEESWAEFAMPKPLEQQVDEAVAQCGLPFVLWTGEEKKKFLQEGIVPLSEENK